MTCASVIVNAKRTKNQTNFHLRIYEIQILFQFQPHAIIMPEWQLEVLTPKEVHFTCLKFV